MRQTDWVRKLATLQHSVDYLESAVREFHEVIEMLTEDGHESAESLIAEKRADNSLASGVRFLKFYKKDNS